MRYFDIPRCEQRACLNWREIGRCVKHNMYIPAQLKFLPVLSKHDDCEMKLQLNTYRLTELIES